jgi:hypothetical protein
MKAVTFLTLILLGAILISGFALAGTIVWDFEDASQLNDLEAINGTWEINNGVLQEVTGAESAMHAYLGEADWENYTIESKIRVDDGKYTGLLFRAMNEFEYYVFYLELTPDPGNIAFFKHVPPEFSSRERPNPNKTDVSARGDLASGEWYALKIIVEGNNFVVFLNGDEVVPEATDDLGNEYGTGKVGVWSWQTKVSFDDFTITSDEIAGEPSAVDSQDKLPTMWGKLRID